RNFKLLVVPHRFERTHVVQAVGEFYQNYPNVVRKGEEHFFKILSLNTGGMIKNVSNFGESVNNGFNFWPKQMLNISKADIRIFHSIVQQSCYNGSGAKTDFFSYNSRYGNRVINIRLA